MIKLENIRNRSGLLLVVIGFAMLAFILTDLMSSSNGAVTSDLVIGEIDGEDIDYQFFEERVQSTLENQRRSNPNINIDQVRNSVWNQIIKETILNKEYVELGVKVGPNELFDMIQGENPYPTVKQSFTNPETGQFDRARLLQFLKEDIHNDETGQAMQQWLSFEDAIRKERQSNKYNRLISSGLSVSNWEAKLNLNEQSEVRNVSYVEIPFSSIPDSFISYSDSDLKSFINENSKKYQQDASRTIEYVVFNVSPSEEDRIYADEWINDIKSDFTQTDNEELFVRKNSDVFNRVMFVSKDDLTDDVKLLSTAQTGTVIGPLKQGANILRLAKLVNKELRPDSVEARHILIKGLNSDAIIDSLKTLISKVLLSLK